MINIIDKCIKYFQKIDIDFDLYIIADTQNRTKKICDYVVHADESEFFSRKEWSEIASALFYIFGFVKVFYSELEFIEFILNKKPSTKECFVYNLSRDGFAEGKKSLIPSFCDLCNLHYTGSNALTISLLRNKWLFSQLVSLSGVLTPESILYDKNSSLKLDNYSGEKMLVKNVYESASQGLFSENLIVIQNNYSNELESIIKKMHAKQVLLQRYIDGLECEVLVLQFEHKYYALEPIEIIINGNCFLDSNISNAYDYSFGTLSDHCNEETINKIKEYAIIAAEVLNIKDYARFDFRIKDNQPYLIDIAGTPYTIKHSSIAYLFEKILGLDYNDIYKVIMACSISNYSSD